MAISSTLLKWGDPAPSDFTAGTWSGWMSAHSEAFDAGVNDLKNELSTAFTALKANPSSPVLLGQYQSRLAEYNMYRMLQSNSTKSLTDQSKSVIRNFV